MTSLQRRVWVPEGPESYIQQLAATYARQTPDQNENELLALIEENRKIHEQDCVNLNPATNTLNPKAEAVLASSLGARPSLGYPGDKYEMGLEAIEKIEVMAAELAAEVFGAKFVEIRVASGAIANLYVFMAVAKAGDYIFSPPTSIGGHVTHHEAGAAGKYGLITHEMAVDPVRYSIDLDVLRADVLRLRPAIISLGGSLNLFPLPLREVRAIADEVGAIVLYDAAHTCGVIAGGALQQPLEEGAHVMTLSTYKSLGGPASGLVLTNDADIAQALDAVAFPGLTANFDVAKSAALAMTLLDWKAYGQGYAESMVRTAKALAQELADKGLPIFASDQGMTATHQFAVEAHSFGGGQTMAKRLRLANILACGIGLPMKPVPGDRNGLRLGTPELVRWGIEAEHMPELAEYIATALFATTPLEQVAGSVSAFRRRFTTLHYVR
ncbi:MAG: aminotransferase class I/II-fold pyridoxal phosphate-dependent enzyme [Burkholderiaceae bacterium]|nr:aminotransferase class I/II-fold pyridoxal phosphate-dependent enzyme [Burkholderiaceae bacterium]